MDLTTIVLVAVIIALGFVVFFNRKTGADVDQDGDIDLQDAKQAVKNTVEGVKETVSEATAEVKKTVKAKPAAKKTTKKKTASVDLNALTKKELLAHAKANGIKSNASMSKQAIIDAINAG